MNHGLPASRNIGIRAARGKYIVPLDADDCIAPDFIRTAVSALERHAEFDFLVVPSVAYFDTDENLFARKLIDYAVFLGDAPSLGLIANRLSTATSLMRKALFDSGSTYNESLTSYEDWDLYLRLVMDGRRMLVTNDLQFFYRRRPGSMIRGVDPARHLGLLGRIYDNLPHPLPASVRARTFLSDSSLNPDDDEVALRHEVADSVNSALKRLPRVHQALKQGTGSLLRLRRNLK